MCTPQPRRAVTLIADSRMSVMVAGRYRLGERIGVGGMATVFRATDELLGREVAVKIFGAGRDPDHPERISTEMRTIASLTHSGLVSVYDAGTDEPDTGHPRAFMVMELIDGPTLADNLSSGALEEEHVRAIGACLADAIAYMHERGVVHRDIKPANVIMDSKGRPHLTDFGVAHSIGAERLTATGTTIGTAAYISPEQVQGGALTPAVDIYSLGLLLLESLTGRREYPGSITESALARISRPPVIEADLPEPWPQLLARMTAMDPAERPLPEEVAEILGAPSSRADATAPVTTGAALVDATQVLSVGPPAQPTAAAATTVFHVPTTSSRMPERRTLAIAGALALLTLIVILISTRGGSGGAPSPRPTGPPALNQLDTDLGRLHDLVAR